MGQPAAPMIGGLALASWTSVMGSSGSGKSTLADEPTGEFDEATTAAALDLLKALRTQRGMAILPVTPTLRWANVPTAA